MIEGCTAFARFGNRSFLHHAKNVAKFTFLFIHFLQESGRKYAENTQEASKKSILDIMPYRTPNLRSPSGAMQLEM
jgi:hypothetical protein